MRTTASTALLLQYTARDRNSRTTSTWYVRRAYVSDESRRRRGCDENIPCRRVAEARKLSRPARAQVKATRPKASLADDEGFVVHGLRWSPAGIRTYYVDADGVEHTVVEWRGHTERPACRHEYGGAAPIAPYDVPFYIIFNVAVGGAPAARASARLGDAASRRASVCSNAVAEVSRRGRNRRVAQATAAAATTTGATTRRGPTRTAPRKRRTTSTAPPAF